jgi:hypothetical protein
MENHSDISSINLQIIATLVEFLGSDIQMASTDASNDFETSATCSEKEYIHLNKNTFNHLTPKVHFSGRTAPLTYRCCIFYLFNRYTY